MKQAGQNRLLAGAVSLEEGFPFLFSHSEVWNFFRIRAISVGYPALTAGFVLLAEMDNESDGPV